MGNRRGGARADRPAPGGRSGGRLRLVGIAAYHDRAGRRYKLRSGYVEALASAGAASVVVPMVSSRREAESALARLDGLLIPGGDDLRPSAWGERPHPEADLVTARKQRSDLELAAAAMDLDLPVLGICYGMQVLNVAAGGSVHQHIPDLGRVCRAHLTRGESHRIELIGDGVLRSAMRAAGASVNSFHHQSVSRLGRGFRTAAAAEDGLIEAIERPDRRFVLGVQWHPERMRDREDQRRLFETFVRGGSAFIRPRRSSPSGSSRPARTA